jgi:hypothetical protein
LALRNDNAHRERRFYGASADKEIVKEPVYDVRTLTGIDWPSWPPMHPAGPRCSSLAYSRYARSSRLAGRAPRRPS